MYDLHMRPLLLSIIIPTRNRNHYLQNALKIISASEREDFEIIICDNSDNDNQVTETKPSFLADGRVIVHRTNLSDRPLSMRRNFSAGLEVARGKWVSFIGDDDIIDPSLLVFLDKLENKYPSTAAVKWNTARFDIDLKTPRENKLPLGSSLHAVSGKDSVLKQTTWPNSNSNPSSLASPYHGAVRKDLLVKLKKKRGVWIRSHIPDYDLGWEVAYSLDSYVMCERPFSISGVSQESNSYSVRSLSSLNERSTQWITESLEMDGWGKVNEPIYFTLPMVVLGFVQSFCKIHKIRATVNKQNFTGAIRKYLLQQEDFQSFHFLKEEFSNWLRKNFEDDAGISSLQYKARPLETFSGLHENRLVASNDVFDNDITKYASIAFGVLKSPERLL